MAPRRMTVACLSRAAMAGLVLLAVGGPAAAQSMSASASSFNAGYGRVAGSENHPIDIASARDANGNRTIIDGVIQTGAGSVSATAAAIAQANGFASVSGGVGTGSSSSASAIGNSLNVVTTGSYNTVIVNSTQTNTGAVTANVNGGVGD